MNQVRWLTLYSFVVVVVVVCVCGVEWGWGGGFIVETAGYICPEDPHCVHTNDALCGPNLDRNKERKKQTNKCSKKGSSHSSV